MRAYRASAGYLPHDSQSDGTSTVRSKQGRMASIAPLMARGSRRLAKCPLHDLTAKDVHAKW